MYDKEKLILPEFPRTKHLPLEPNASSDDKVASLDELNAFLKDVIYVQEKVDGANCGITIYDGQPLVRNRNHILNKAYSVRKTPAKQQFSAVWTWVYNHLDNIKELHKLAKTPLSIYGEWMHAQHVVPYNKLTDWFIAYDLYDYQKQKFIDAAMAEMLLADAGFEVVGTLAASASFTAQDLLDLRDGESAFSTLSPREGIYLKSLNKRYKMVAPWFQSDPQWNKKALVKNTCLR